MLSIFTHVMLRDKHREPGLPVVKFLFFKRSDGSEHSETVRKHSESKFYYPGELFDAEHSETIRKHSESKFYYPGKLSDAELKARLHRRFFSNSMQFLSRY